MPNRINSAMATEYSARFGTAPDLVAVDYQGLTVEEAVEVRNEARAKGLEMVVVKNSVACAVLRQQLPENGLEQVITGQTALIYGAEMPDLARFVHEQGKKIGKFTARGGLFEKGVIPSEQVDQFRAIPDRPTLLSQTLATIIAPLTGSLAAMNSLLTAPAALADALAKKKEEGE